MPRIGLYGTRRGSLANRRFRRVPCGASSLPALDPLSLRSDYVGRRATSLPRTVTASLGGGARARGRRRRWSSTTAMVSKGSLASAWAAIRRAAGGEWISAGKTETARHEVRSFPPGKRAENSSVTASRGSGDRESVTAESRLGLPRVVARSRPCAAAGAGARGPLWARAGRRRRRPGRRRFRVPRLRPRGP